MTPGDKYIISLIGRNPERGFKMLLEKYQRPVYWHIRRMVVSHDDAQDATQEAFVRMFRSFGSYSGDAGSFRSWVYRIATNEALRVIGARRGNVVSVDSEETGVGLMAADSYVDYENGLAVRFQQAILSLPPKQQLAFNLRYYDDMSFDEIACVAASTPSSMKACYHIAKEKIVKYMNSDS